MLKIYNTLTRSVEEFVPLKDNTVGMYSCGPTVYDYQHIGHMRRYVGDDLLIRVLKRNGFIVHHVMNITDVGHLTSDSDTGEDKMEKGAKKFGMTVWDIAKKFENQFKESCVQLNITLPKDLMHATDYIPQQIALVKKLEERGYTYNTNDGIYFDTSKFPDYFMLSRQNPQELKAGARVDLIEEKKHVTDFALWKFSPSTNSGQVQKRQMEWDSPWGVGFPGWHIECSAMGMKALGESFDIHTGGIDHINIHHTNEIAQSEAATGKPFVKYWVHHNFLVVEGQKMSKSLGNFFTVQDVIKKGYDPLALRYLYLQTHYRQEMNFTWEALDGAQKALTHLREIIKSLKGATGDGFVSKNIANEFLNELNNDLNTSKALSIMWEMLKTTNEFIPASYKLKTLYEMDIVLGLELDRPEMLIEIPKEIMDLMNAREGFRKAGDFQASDELRKKIHDLGYTIQDTKDGPEVLKI